MEKSKTIDTNPTLDWLRNILLSQEGILFIIMVVAVLLLATQSSVFATPDNLLGQGQLLAEVALVAIPMTFIIITGGIDLSVGSIFGLCAVVFGYSWDLFKGAGIDPSMALLLAIGVMTLTGLVAGFINGAFIVFVGVPPLIMTLATLAFYRGLAVGISEAKSVRGYPEWFFTLGQGHTPINVFGTPIEVPVQLWIVIIAVIIAGIILARTTFGRTLYAIGNNETASRFSGLPVDRAKLIIYTFSGFMAALAGLIFVSRVTTTRSDMGSGLELDAIAAVVVGGTSIFGGTGSILGTVIGVVLIQLLKNGLTLTGQFTSDTTIIIIGSVLILSILVNNYIQQRRANG